MRKAVFDGLMKNVPGVFFWQFFLLNLVSDYVILGVTMSSAAVWCIPGLAALTAWVESLLFQAIVCVAPPRGARKVGGYIWYWILLVVHNILLVTDVFLLAKFNTVISQQALDVVLGTDAAEAAGFIKSYFSVPLFVGGLAAVVVFNLLVYFGGRFLAYVARRRRWMGWLKYALVVAGALVFGYMVYGFVRYRHGAQIPTFTAPTRMVYSLIQRHANNKRTERLLDICRNTQVQPGATPGFDIVFVLGESYSLYHSPLYGYALPTTPHQSLWAAEGSLTVFKDVVTPEDWTQKVLVALLCPGKNAAEFGSHPLLPALLRKAGWPVRLYDNEFVVSHDSFFFTRPDLSALMFDSRNTEREKYDGDLVATVVPQDSAAFTMIHLMGQHFQYEDRYTPEYKHFAAGDYDPERFSATQREILAHYDNATLYNDAVLGQIVEKYVDRDAIVIYVSDHGEEIFDCRDYFGHGTALSATTLDYQLRVPMMIWTSAIFRQKHPELQQAIEAAADEPISTNDMAHFLLDLAGVNTPELDPTRSFINPGYDSGRPRIVLNSIDFDNQ